MSLYRSKRALLRKKSMRATFLTGIYKYEPENLEIVKTEIVHEKCNKG